MKKKIKIGLPKPLLSHYYILWKNYFNLLNCHIILSKETFDNKRNIKDTTCYPYQKYLNNLEDLIPKCDYILTTKNICHNKICPKITNIYNDVNILTNKEMILTINITNKLFHTISLLYLGLKLTKRPLKVIYSYLLSKYNTKNYQTNKLNEIKNKLTKQNHKVLLISNTYILEDLSIINNINNYLKQSNIIPIYPNYLENNISLSFSNYYPYKISNTSLKQLLGSIYYYKDQVDAIIYLEDPLCLYTYHLTKSLHSINKPLTNINIHTISLSLLYTKLECLIDILNN